MSEAAFKRRIEGLLAGPVHPGKPFLPTTPYRQVYRMAAHVRAYFSAENAQTSVVCLCSEDRAVTAAAVLATLAGGPALVLPHAFDLKTLEALQRLTGFRHAIIDGLIDLPSGVRGFAPEIAKRPWPPVSAPVDPDRKWLYLFTGGTTGTPLLWPKTVRNLLAETFYLQDTHQVTAEDRFVATVSPYHIYGLLYSLLLPLSASAFVSSSTPSFPAEIESALRENAATILISVPAHYRALNGFQFKPAGLRIAFSSAGMLAENDAAAFNTQTGVPVVEIYGSTETGGVASRVRAAGQADYRAFDSLDLKIEKEAVLIRSDYLSPGLNKRADGWFRMGDRAVATAENRFILLGREDGIVKVAGKRVDLEAVRQTLKQDPRITDALVLSLTVGRSRENQIVAVIEGCLTVAELTLMSRNVLAPYARPRRFKIVDRLPMTAAGKYDRKTIEGLFL